MRSLLAICLGFTSVAYSKSNSSAEEDRVKKEWNISYTLGHQIGKSLKEQGIDLNLDVLSQSIKDTMKDTPSKLTQEQMMEAMKSFQSMIAKRRSEQASLNKEEGEKNLTKNKSLKGVVTTKSGLQYKVVRQGKGKNPTKDSTVKVHYRGTLVDGTEFDSSYKRNQPATFPVQGVIPGWTEALQIMKPGAKWDLMIPSELAYGTRGNSSIPPNSVLKFTVELLEIVNTAKTKG
jgi:FKBP-type peptidyl-prolyl cis-trans isomerase